MSDKPSPIKELLDTHFLNQIKPPFSWDKPQSEWVTLVIRFGQEDDDFGSTETFRFRTKEEADAFMTGVEVSNGWLEYTVLEDGRYPEVKK